MRLLAITHYNADIILRTNYILVSSEWYTTKIHSILLGRMVSNW